MPRTTLSREQIVRAAIELLDAEGVEGLSMRRLGERLGSAATAVYWHVRNKDELLVLAADQVWGEVELPDPGEIGWRAAAATMASSLHSVILKHLWLVSTMSTHMVYGPGKARHDDHCIAVYEAAGFADHEVEWAMTSVYTFIVGTALSVAAETAWRARLRRNGSDEDERVREALAPIIEIAVQFPRLRARMEADANVTIATPHDAFVFGLDTILDGLEVRLARNADELGLRG